MSRKKTTTTDTSSNRAIQFDPQSMAFFHDALDQAKSTFPILSGYATNPFGNPFFTAQYQMLNKQASTRASGQMDNIMSNLRARGIDANTAMGASAIARQSRTNSAANANAFLASVLNAQDNQWKGLQGLLSLSNFRPLQTGESSQEHSEQVQKSGGLGSWLGPAIGLGLGAVTGGLGMIPGIAGGWGGALAGATGLQLPGGGGGAMRVASEPTMGMMPGPWSSTPSTGSWNIGGILNTPTAMPSLYRPRPMV